MGIKRDKQLCEAASAESGIKNEDLKIGIIWDRYTKEEQEHCDTGAQIKPCKLYG